METKVSLAKCRDYNCREVEEKLRECLLPLKLRSLIKEDQTVLIKPNMFQGFSPDKNVTTHPSVVKALIQIIQEIGAEVIVGDNPACLKCGSKDRYLKIAEITGIKKVVEETNASLIYPDEGVKISDWIISRTALEVDIIINVPKLKGHGFMGLTGAVKNIFGLIPGLNKLDYHAQLKEKLNFAKMLVDLCRFLKPKLTVIDAIKIIDKEGSIKRRPKSVKAIIASRDPFAADLVAAKLLRLNPMMIPTIAVSLRKEQSLINAEIIGMQMEKFRLPKLNFFLAEDSVPESKLEPQSIGSKNRSVPEIDRHRCRICGACVMICPVSAIRVEDEALVMRKNFCIKCYCCLEACQFGAMSLD